MMIADAIDSATTEHAVYFLVTAYIESLHHFHRSLGIPERVIELPIAGAEDLAERLAALRHNINVPLEGVVGASEADAILARALARLRELSLAHEGPCEEGGERARKAA
ncbi:MAG: hypothetical protein ACXW20_10240 [Burkholderiales bacterium]